MKNILLSGYLFLFSISLYSQTAPDFEITDYNNENHKLYGDYLNKGKVVMIKIMFADCPPCNSIAPQVEQLWQQFGGNGNEDVQFLELSNKNWDTNSDILQFANKHGLTFPGAGTDGGSLAAVQPYVDGEFGQFFGTPTFIVIGTDGSVEFKVPFNQLKSTIESKLGGQPRTKIEGIVKYADQSPMEGVSIMLQNPGEQANVVVTTDVNGRFEFFLDQVNASSGAELFPSYDALNHTQGISTKDIVITLRHLLQIEHLATPLLEFAADTDRSGSVSTRDLVEIRKIILGLEDRFDTDNGYVFICEQDNSPGNGNARQRLLIQDIVDETVTADFLGNRLGDVAN